MSQNETATDTAVTDLQQTIATMPDADLGGLGDLDAGEIAAVKRLRLLRDESRQRGRPYRLIIEIEGNDVSFWDGHPSGRVTT